MGSDVKGAGSQYSIQVPTIFGVKVTDLGFKLDPTMEKAAIKELDARIAKADKLDAAKNRAVRALSNAQTKGVIQNADVLVQIVREFGSVPDITINAAKAKYDEKKSPEAKELYEALSSLKAMNPEANAKMKKIEEEAKSILPVLGFIWNKAMEKNSEPKPAPSTKLTDHTNIPSLRSAMKEAGEL